MLYKFLKLPPNNVPNQGAFDVDSFFEKGVRLKGTLSVNSPMRFNADLEGEINSSDHFIVGPSGFILGDIHTHDCSSRGLIEGNVTAKNKVALMKDSKLTGDISAYDLVVEEGAKFNGRCKIVDAQPLPALQVGMS